MMKQYSGLILALCCLVTSTWAWGGLFNRFNPSLMNDMYGGSYGKELFRAAESRPGAQVIVKSWKLVHPNTNQKIFW